MTTTASGVDYKSAPADYAALHEMYFPYMVNLVSKNGIDDNNKEDVACDIFLRLMEHGFLEDFNPDLVFEYEGQLRPARFKSFLSRIVSLYVRGYYDKQKRLAHRESQICDLVVSDVYSGRGVEKTTWVDLHGEPTPDHSDDVIDMVAEQQEAEGVRQWLATRERRSIHDHCDLVELYDEVRSQVLSTGQYDVQRLQERFGIGTTTMHTWLWWLKTNLAALYGRPTPRKRARVLRPKVTP